MTVRREGPGAAKVLATMQGLDGLEGKVGWFESAHYPNGVPVAYVATVQEFGTDHTPARPFMRPAVADHGGEWMQLIADGAEAALAGTHTPEQVLELVTLAAAGNVAEKIAAVMSPALHPATIAARARRNKSGGASTKPLVDSGLMIQSVTGKVERTK